MHSTKVTENTRETTNRYKSSIVTKPDFTIIPHKIETTKDYSVIINKIMFTGLAISVATVFYFAISSLFL